MLFAMVIHSKMQFHTKEVELIKLSHNPFLWLNYYREYDVNLNIEII